jgi:hypothetical protein
MEVAQISGAMAITSSSGSFDHTCVLVAGGAVWCWGDRSNAGSAIPQPVMSLSPRQRCPPDTITSARLGPISQSWC